MTARQVIPVTVLTSTLSGIRDRVVQFALDIERENPEAGEAAVGEQPIADERVSQIFNQNFFGDNTAVAAAGRDVHQTQVASSMTIRAVENALEALGVPGEERSLLLDALDREGLPEDGTAGPDTGRWMERLEQGAVAVGTGVSVQTAVAVIGNLLGL